MDPGAMEDTYAPHAGAGQSPGGSGQGCRQISSGRSRQLTKRGISMKKHSLLYGLLAASCALGTALPRQAFAEVSDEDFKAVKNMLLELSQKVKNLEQAHDRDQQLHQQDQQKIDQLQQDLGQTQQLA